MSGRDDLRERAISAALWIFVHAWGELQMRPLAKWTLVAELSGGVLGGAMAVSGYGVWSLVGQQIFTSVVALAGIWKASDWHPGLRFSAPHLRDMLGFGLTMAGSNFLRLFTERVDRVMVGSLMGAASLGLYVVGARLVVAGASVYAAVVWLLAPGLVRAVIDLGLRGVGPLGAGKSARPSSE